MLGTLHSSHFRHEINYQSAVEGEENCAEVPSNMMRASFLILVVAILQL